MKKKLLAGLATVVLLLGMASMASAIEIAHWGFDETSGLTASDSVGGVNGALFGGAAFTTTGGILGGAIQINDGYVNMGDNFGATSNFSIEAWVNIADGDTTGMTPVAKHRAGIMEGYFLSINNINDGFTQTGTEGFYSANGPYTTAVGGPPVNDGLWHQLVGVYDNGVTRIYVDGNLAGSGSAGFANNNAGFLVGGYDINGVPINAFSGLIDEVSVYNNALSGDDVRAIYDGTVNQAAPVPEPATIALLGIGLAGLAGGAARRKWKKKAVDKS